MMNLANFRHSFLALLLLIFSLSLSGKARAAGPLLIAYGGHNETMAPFLVGIEKGCSESTESIPEYCRPAAGRS